MKESLGDIWLVEADWRVIPTNGYIRKDGTLAMGAGLALQAAKRYCELPLIFGELIVKNGLHVEAAYSSRVVSFPVKTDFKNKASLGLIRQSSQELADLYKRDEIFGKVVMPRVGCGLGGLRWEDVQVVLDEFLLDVVVVMRHPYHP